MSAVMDNMKKESDGLHSEGDPILSQVMDNAKKEYDGINSEGDLVFSQGDLPCRRTLLERVFPTGYWQEFKGTMNIAWALVLSQVCQISFQPVATMFGGHLGKLELDAIGLSNTLINVLGDSVGSGFSTCLDTVLSQSFGMGNFKMLGLYLQKGFILHFLLLMPLYALHLNIKPILLALGQQEEVVELTAQYLLYFMPGMFFLFMLTVVRKFTQCQNIVIPHIFIVLIGHAVHAILQYLFLYQFKFGITGSSIAQAITFFLMFVMTVVFTRCSKAYQLCWTSWSFRCLLDWGPLCLLGVFGMLMLCLEWWAWEGSVILCGIIGETELAAQSVTFNLDVLFFGIPLGIGMATSIRVGQFLGAGNKQAAINSSRVGMTITVANALIWSILFLAARSELPKLFTSDTDVINLVSQILPFASIYVFGDAISTIGRGVLRGIGKQKLGTVIIFIAYYVIALPIAIPLTFLTPLGIKGIWVGFPISLSITSVIYIVLINFGLDWDKLVDEAKARACGKVHLIEPDEKTALLSTPSSETALLSEEIHIKTSVYVKRAVTVVVAILLPVAGLVIRIITTQGSAEGDSSLSQVFNTTTTPSLNETDVTSTYTLLWK